MGRQWTDDERVKLVEYAITVTKLLDRTLGECVTELARIVRAYRRQKSKEAADGR